MTARLETTALLSADAPERSNAQSYMERFRAPFSLRCGALLVDYILLAGIIAFSTLIARMGGHQRASQSNAQVIGIYIAAIVAAINFIALPAWRGQTLGKWATGLCVRQKDGEVMGWGRSLLRHLIVYPPIFILGIAFIITDPQLAAVVVEAVVDAIKGAFGGRVQIAAIGGAAVCFLTLALGFAMAAFDTNGRSLHDIIAGTVVVRESAKRRRSSVKV